MAHDNPLRKRLLDVRIQKIDDETFNLGLPGFDYVYVVWEKKSFDELMEYGFRTNELKSAVVNSVYRGTIALELHEAKD